MEFPPSTARTATSGCRRDSRDALGTSPSASIVTKVAPASRSRDTIGASASRVAVGQPCSRTTAPSPWAIAPSTTARSMVAGTWPPSPRRRRASRRPGSRGPPRGLDPRVVRARAERAAEPRARVVAGRLEDRPARLGHVPQHARGGEQRHAGMVVGVVADEVAVRRDPACRRRVRLGPAALDEARGPQPGRPAGRGSSRSRRVARPVGVLDVERQRDPERSAAPALATRITSRPR